MFRSAAWSGVQAFPLMSRECGHVLSTLVQTCRQVWLVLSPLTETSRRTLRSVPVVPGELLTAAFKALECTSQATQTRKKRLASTGVLLPTVALGDL